MTRLSANRLDLPKKIGNKTAFQQARILSRNALSRINLEQKRTGISKNSKSQRLVSFEWSNLIFSIDKALSKITSPNQH